MRVLRELVSKHLIISILSLLSLLSILSINTYATTDDAIAYWSFDSNVTSSEYQDSSGNSRPQIIQSGSFNDFAVKILGDAGITFATADYVESDIDNALANQSEFTISGWFKFNDPSVSQFPIYTENLGNDVFGIQSSGDVLYFLMYDASEGGQSNYCNFAYSSTDYNHIVWAFDGAGSSNQDKNKVYLNNVLQSFDGCTGTFPSSTIALVTDFALGAKNDGSSGYTGSMDEFALYLRNLTNDEISELYNGGVGFNPYLIENNNRPLISGINLTSGNSPSGDNQTPYRTNDTTPTFIFDTDINSNCSIGLLNQNFSDMGTTRVCAGGQETTSHTCTVIGGDVMDRTLSQDVFISCINIDAPLNQTLLSTSGALDVDVIDNPTIDIRFFVNELFYSNQTVEVDENFLVKLNYTGEDRIINDSTCNFTAQNISTVFTGVSNATICSVCDFNPYTFTQNDIDDEVSPDFDDINFDICHIQSPVQSATVQISCPLSGGVNESFNIPAGNIPTCPTVLSYTQNVSNCGSFPNITVTVDNNAIGVNQGHRILNFRYDRHFFTHVSELEFNITDDLWGAQHVHNYLIGGTYDIIVNCSNSDNISNKSFTETLIVGNIPPFLQHVSIRYDGTNVPFTDGVQINTTNNTIITFFENINDANLKNHTTRIINASGDEVYIAVNVGTTPLENHSFNATFFNNDTWYNFSSEAFDTDAETSTLNTSFKIVILDNSPPVVTFSSADNFKIFISNTFNLNYTPTDNVAIDNCSLFHNRTAWGRKNTDDTITNGVLNSFVLDSSALGVGNYSYYIECVDDVGLAGYTSGNQSFHIVTTLPPPLTYYNNTAIDNTRWFNTEILDASTTAGVLMHFFIFLLIVGLVVFAEFTRVPAFMLLVSIGMFFYAILLYSKVSAIFGIIFFIMGGFYTIRSFVGMNE